MECKFCGWAQDADVRNHVGYSFCSERHKMADYVGDKELRKRIQSVIQHYHLAETAKIRISALRDLEAMGCAV